jgi:hypothetical protein
MKIKAIGTNQTELHTEKFIILFSYNTPVCGNVEGRFLKSIAALPANMLING